MTRRTIARLMAGIAVSAAAAIGPAGCRTPDVTGTPGDEPGGKYITAVTEKGQLDRILAAETRKPVIVYFKTPYCGACRRVNTIYDKLSGEYRRKARFVAVDMSKFGDPAIRYTVVGSPTILIFNRGKETQRIVGRPEEEDLRNAIRKAL